MILPTDEQLDHYEILFSRFGSVPPADFLNLLNALRAAKKRLFDYEDSLRRIILSPHGGGKIARGIARNALKRNGD